MTEEYARKIISHHYPDAKFEAFAHTDDFMEPEAQIGRGYYYVSLYDEKIESSRLNTNEGVIIIGNTYLSSFAYNLALSWIYESSNGVIGPDFVSPLLKYNLKKFYAEQLYHRHNNVFSRAVLLETLLYQQHLMIPIFAEIDVNTEWAATAKMVSQAMSNFVLFHEVGHYYLQYLPASVDELFTANEAVVKPFLQAVELQYDARLIEEVKCDVFSVYLRLLADKDDKTAMQFSLRATVLGYASMAILYAIQGSAEKTAEEHRKIPDNVELKSIETSTQEYSYILEVPIDDISAEMLLRAKLMITLCESIALKEGIGLYGIEGMLQLSGNALDYLKSFVYKIMEEGSKNERAIARLIAEGFHNHPEGIEYLYLKSKVFKSERELKL